MFFKHRTYFLLTCFLSVLLISLPTFAQRTQKSRTQLEREKRKNLEKIAETRKAMENTRVKKEVTVGNIKAIKEQISTQEKQISLMEEDIELINMEMQDIVSAKGILENKLAKLQQEYAAMLYSASKHSGQLNKLSFLFSSSSFNELLMRYKYLQQYTENRKAQVLQMTKVTALLRERQSNLEGKRTDKKKIITAKVVETKNLEVLKTKQTQMVGELSKKEKELRREIEETRQSVTKLDNLIAGIVSREISRKNKETELKQDKEVKLKTTRPAKKDNKAIIELDEAETTLGRSFGASRTRLPWPVQRGFISDRFGVKEHPVLHGVLINNNGIDIQTPSNATVRAVYTGVVKDITTIPGLGKVVAIQHGDYFTVYANLNQVFASVGQKINTKETIGTAGESGGTTEINFQIWHNTERLNPESWLAPK